MYSKFAKRMLALIICAISLFSLSACSEAVEDTSFSTPQTPQTVVEVTKGGGVSLPEGFVMPVESGKMSVGFTGSEIFAGFTLLSTGKTAYFTTSGSVTISFSASLFVLKNKEYVPASYDAEYMNVAVALFKKSGNNTIYQQTANLPAIGETHSATFSGLDAAAEYCFVITYSDVARTRVTGTFSASGVTAPAAPIEGDTSTSQP